MPYLLAASRGSRRLFFAALLTSLSLLAATFSVGVGAQPTAAAQQVAAAPNTSGTPDAAINLPTSARPSQSVVVDNPYGLKALWEQGDFVAKGALIILIVMSGASWYVLIAKLMEQRGLHRHASQTQGDFWRQSDLRAASRALPDTSVFRYVADTGFVAHRQYAGKLSEQIDLNAWLSQSIGQAIDAVGDRLQGGLSVLATVGSTAPFVGLFGTVWGIYHALTAIGIAGQASIDKVAGPVGEALIMTAIGLAVAVPAVLGYNWLIRRNKAALEEVRAFGGELHTVLLGGTPTAALED
jgi:biopolymer transport protein ExbB